jgi:hypothetical protein
MNIASLNGLTFCTFSLFSNFPELFAVVSTRDSENDGCEDCVRGEMKYRSEAAVYETLGISRADVSRVHQIHSNAVAYVQSPGFYGNGDGLITDKKNVLLQVVTADCLPVFFYDSKKKAIGLIHAGWRGLRQNIIITVVQEMQKQFKTEPRELYATVGPYIKTCCYTVREDVSNQFDKEFLYPAQNGTYRLDLGAAARKQFNEAGIPEKQIEIAEECTFCRKDLFHSARRDKEITGENVSLFALHCPDYAG